MTEHAGDARWARLSPLLIVLAVAASYAGGLSGAFVFDDIRWIVRGAPPFASPWGLFRNGRPVLDATFALNRALHGLWPEGYRLGNVAIHLAAALTLYGVLRRILERAASRERRGANGAALACAAAALWAAHPLVTGSVTYISQRAESLMGLFFLLSFYAALRAFEADPPPGGAGAPAKGVRRWFPLAVLACWLGAGAKEVMVVCPLLVFLYDWLFVSGSPAECLRRRWRLYAGLAVAWPILLLLGWARRRLDAAAFYAWEGIGPWNYFLTQCGVLAHYLRLSFWPHPLCLDYDWPVARHPAQVWPQMLLLLALGMAGLRLLWRRHAAGFAAAWFFAILAPTSSFVARPDCAFEHRMYLPLAAVLAVALAGARALIGGFTSGAARTGMAAALVAVAAFATRLRNADYADEVTLWSRVVEVRPANLRARNDLAAALSEAGRVREALDAYAEVLDRIPGDLRARMDSGLHSAPRPFLKQSFEYHYYRAHANMGLLLARETGDVDGAVRHFRAALGVAPSDRGLRAKLDLALRIQRQRASGAADGGGSGANAGTGGRP